MTSMFHKFGSHLTVQKLVDDHSNRMIGHSSNRWLNVRINDKIMDRADVISKELRQVSSEGFDISMVNEERFNLTMCVYGPYQEAMNFTIVCKMCNE